MFLLAKQIALVWTLIVYDWVSNPYSNRFCARSKLISLSALLCSINYRL